MFSLASSVRGSDGSVRNSVRGSDGSVHNVRSNVHNVRGSIRLLMHGDL